MIVGEDRGAGVPISVDFRCARTTDDDLVLIGGYVTHAPPAAPTLIREGANAGIALKLGSPYEGRVVIGYGDAPALDCIGYLEHNDELVLYRQGGMKLPGFVDDGSVEFGPGAEPAP